MGDAAGGGEEQEESGRGDRQDEAGQLRWEKPKKTQRRAKDLLIEVRSFDGDDEGGEAEDDDDFEASLTVERRGAAGGHEVEVKSPTAASKEKLHQSLHQLEIDLGRVKELLKVDGYKKRMSGAAETIPSPNVGVVRRRNYGTGKGPATIPSTALVPATPEVPFVVPSSSDVVVGGSGGLDVSRRPHSQSEGRSPAASSSRSRSQRRQHHTLAVISLDTTPINTDEDNDDSPGLQGRRSRKHYLVPSPQLGQRTAVPTTRSPSPNRVHPAQQSQSHRGNGNTTGGGGGGSSGNHPGNAASANGGRGNGDASNVDKMSPPPPPPPSEHSISEYCCFWPFSLLSDRPILRLFLVMFLNGLLSMGCSALIMQIERPSQQKRMDDRKSLQAKIDSLMSNLTDLIDLAGTDDYDPVKAVELLDTYNEAVPQLSDHPEEIEWDMLNAQAFITSVQTTTGYGDIIPVTGWGKLFTGLYAIVGIPVFMWYIVKLGAVFRLVVMKVFFGLLLCLCPGLEDFETASPDNREEADRVVREGRLGRRMSTITRLRLLDLNMRLKQQYYSDKRFHPVVIGIILVIFLCSVAAFISYMEKISYFDSFYAAFITYSTIGFGDIDIFKISYRSNWFNLLIYGNFVHIAGYMILSAWVASLLEKCGVRKY